MRVPEEIKLGLESCHAMKPGACEHCPYRPSAKCSEFLGEDAVQYIKRLEAEIEELEAEIEELETKVEELENEQEED